ncbi:DUF975 family protein [bacterium D16-51]|nr:DUF975 family protein [bacterium D16-59]RKI59376.1 DUF975 family protein [bacterium D16-51]
MEGKVQWTRRELKRRSKAVLHTYYWRIVLVALLLSLLMDGDRTPVSLIGSVVQGQTETPIREKNPKSSVVGLTSTYRAIRDWVMERQYVGSIVVGTAMLTVIVLFFIVAFSGILLSIFIVNPLYVGGVRFYNRAFDTKPRFKELFHVFEYKYRNVVSIMFLRDVYILLWCLLFIVPGIIKSYEYLVVPYILSEHPDMQAKEAFAASRQLMRGQKWKAFVLDLSFLGWAVLSGMTFGVLGIFFVSPYRALTFTALYRKLLGGDVIPHNIYYDGMEEEAENGWYSLPDRPLPRNGQEGKQEV